MQPSGELMLTVMRDAERATAVLQPGTLGAFLHRLPVAPCDVAALLGSDDAYAAFRRVVRAIFPEAEAEILAADGATAMDRETERCWAFVHRVEAKYFPCYEFEEYAQVACGVPFVRFGWGFDDFHELDLPLGKLLLFALCEQPYPTGCDTRIPLLDAVGDKLPEELVARIPREGIHPDALHQRLDGGRFAAAAEFADWLWSSTGTIFLDADQEVEVWDADWSRETVLALAEEWRAAQAIMDHVRALEAWLEQDPPRHFAELLDAASGAVPSATVPPGDQAQPRVDQLAPSGKPGEANETNQTNQGRPHAIDTREAPEPPGPSAHPPDGTAGGRLEHRGEDERAPAPAAAA